MIEYIGAVAAILATISFFPQVVRTVKYKSTDSMSWSWLIMYSTGALLWVIYGIGKEAFSIIVANTIVFICVIVILFVKVKDMNKRADGGKGDCGCLR